MKIHIAYDNSGKILAAVESVSPIQARPEVKQGVSVSEFEVPAKFSGKKLQEYLHRLRVDVDAGRLVETQ